MQSTIITKGVFIALSVLITTTFIIHYLLLITKWVIEEITCQKLEAIDVNYSTTIELDSSFSRLFDFLNICIGFIHIPEHIYLLIHLYKFIEGYGTWNELYKENLKKKMTTFALGKLSDVNLKRLRFILFMVVPVVFIGVTFTLTIIAFLRYYYYRSDNDSLHTHCNGQLSTVSLVLTGVIYVVAFGTNMIILLVRFLMIYFTVMVGVMWRRVEPCQSGSAEKCVIYSNPSSAEKGLSTAGLADENKLGDQGILGQPNQNIVNTNPSLPASTGGYNTSSNTILMLYNDLQEVGKTYKEYLDDYKARKEYVTPIYKIFRSFFVLQWIIHLFNLFTYISHLLRPWIRHGWSVDVDTLSVTYQILYITFHGLALMITYTCALKMNAYLRRYVRGLQEKQLKKIMGKNTVQFTLTHLFVIKTESVSKSSFMPRIPGTGLSISINNPGFVLSIVFCVFGLIASQIKF